MVRFAAAALALAITSCGLAARGAESQILLLDFWSPQCGPCMGMKPTMHALEQANYPIQEIDTTRDIEGISQKYHVTSIPCFVMLVDGKEVAREVGATSSEQLQQMFEKAKDVVMQNRRFRGVSPDTPVTRPADSTGRIVIPAVEPPRDTQSSGPLGAPNVATPPSTPAAAGSDFPPTLMAATVRLCVNDAQGRSFGTGTIVDSRSGEALIVTCGHLFRDSNGKGSIVVEMFEFGPNGPKLSGQFPGTLISFDLKRDVAFVSFKPKSQVVVAAVAPEHAPIQRGDRVATIGCSNGKDPTLLPQRINVLDRYQGPPNIEVSGAPEEGRSGGGLFNLQGQLIGVCNAADYEGKEGIYAALDSVQQELNRIGLKDVYAKSEPAPKPAGAGVTSTVMNDPIVRGQAPRDESTSPPAVAPIPSMGTKSTSPQSLNPTEQAALGEIMQRAATSEVMIIVRPKVPGGQSDIITLDNASPEFVRVLEAQRRNPPATITK